ncbi:MAG: hypothetical protein HKN33_08700 [Pyrinomonadaceae bacterium]|nr:hypothetical protein [Pyrinomonadaceae bacterium]
MIVRRFSLFLCLGLSFFLSGLALAQDQKSPVNAALSNLSWRNIGPALMGGRTSDVVGVPGNPSIVYVATASGGIFKTVDGGISWKPIFEREGSISVGDIAVEPGNPNVIWVGTGESNARNSVSFGDGIYKSTDGGKTWKHVGLRETNTISRIIINPRDPDNVFVAAVGRVWGRNTERGVFVTHDGGKTWKKTLYIDDQHGASDLRVDPTNPNVVIAGMWRFDRKPWTFTSGSEKGGIFRSIDGGETWKKITKGLPKLVGRIGLAIAPSNSDVVYAMLEAKEGTLWRSDDNGVTFKNINKQKTLVARGFYYTQVEVDPNDHNKVYAVASLLFKSLDGGRRFTRIARRAHIDFHALWIDPTNSKRMWHGQDGGVGVSYDEGKSWEYVNNWAGAQFYQIFADNSLPFYNVSGGLQDNGTWVGPSRSREPSGIHNEDWRMVSFGDGFFSIQHPDNPNLFLTESQGGNVYRTDMKTREQQYVTPAFGNGGAAENSAIRFNWNAPLVPSPHDKNTVYLAGNVVFKSTDFGVNWTKISDDLTAADPERLKDAGGPVFPENTTAEYFATIISLAESPLRKDTIWVGTDDGKLQMTTDGGKVWNNVISKLAGVPADSSVSHVEPSRFDANTVYVAVDRHKFDDYRPHVFKTTDNGRTFQNISGDLPKNAYVHVVRKDPRNRNLIYAGTELGVYATFDGRNWFGLGMKNFPRVAVHDMLIHPRDNDIVLGTHGRGAWVFDDASVVQQMTPAILARDGHVFSTRKAYRYAMRMTRYGQGDKRFTGPNPPRGALITYHLKDKVDKKTPVRMVVSDSSGKKIFEHKKLPKKKGVNRFAWNLTHEGAVQRRPPTPAQLEFGGPPRGPQVLPGTYTAEVFVGTESIGKTSVVVEVDPTVQITSAQLKEQFDLAMKLRDMNSELNKKLRALDSVRKQSLQIEQLAKDRVDGIKPDLSKAFKNYRKKHDTLVKSIATDPADRLQGPNRYSNLVSRLYGTVSGGNFAPTAAMKKQYTKLNSEFPEVISKIDQFVDKEIPAFNKVLRDNKLPEMSLLK